MWNPTPVNQSNRNSPSWQRGDRVRVIAGQNPYTGCRGTIVQDPHASPGDQLPLGYIPLGYYVAIDGENGVAQPFLTDALERVSAVSCRQQSRSHDLAVNQATDPRER
jgi:hypothetical protein